MEDKKRVLFVDDEARILDGLRRMMRPLRTECHMAFACSGREALEWFAEEPFDVIISDMRMPGMSGEELLSEIARLYPHAIRIVLSGQSEREKIMRSINSTYQYLSKPCDAETLKATVSRACALSETLGEAHHHLRQLLAGIRTLPSLPTLYSEILEELHSPKSSIKNVGAIVARDIGMSSKLLQLVNSAFFGVARSVSNPQRATIMLGLDIVKSLVLSVHLFSQWDGPVLSALSPDRLWEHSMRVAKSARWIAQAEGADGRGMDDAFAAGLLHDAGKLVLASNFPDHYRSVLDRAIHEGVPIVDVEREVFGATHADIGAHLFGLWGLPEPVVAAVAFHHTPAKQLSTSFNPVLAVHVADVLDYELHPSRNIGAPPSFDGSAPALSTTMDRLPLWRRICEEHVSHETEP